MPETEAKLDAVLAKMDELLASKDEQESKLNAILLKLYRVWKKTKRKLLKMSANWRKVLSF